MTLLPSAALKSYSKSMQIKYNIVLLKSNIRLAKSFHISQYSISLS